MIAGLAVGCTVLAASVLGSGVWLLASARAGLPGKDAIGRMGDMAEATIVYDAHDKLAFTIFNEQRIDVPLADVSPHLVHAIIAVEDQRFYTHHGFDLIRIASAAFANVRRGRAAQGGSTITQQLARQSFLTADKTIRRKLQELILAERIEVLYQKAEILELYLNKVYFGDGLYGVEAASRGYFGKHASELSLPEAALLAGLVKSPSAYAPTANLERATTRRNLVLQIMLDSGVIDRQEWQRARTAHVVLRDTLRTSGSRGQYFEEQVRQELVERFGWEKVYQGGLRVYSTIDMDLQDAAEASVAQSLKALDEKREALARARRTPSNPAPLQAALIAMDPRTGYVRAMVGGRDFAESRFNRAVQARRQPGSAFKPFVYAAALEAGYTPATILDHLNDEVATPQGNWAPADGHSTAESMTLRTALKTSSNRAAVRLLQQVGIPQTVEYAKAMGIGDVPSVPSLALGSGEVTLQSLTAAYGAFANHGMVSRPILIRRVDDTAGTILYTTELSSVRAISDTTAYLMSTMLADVINGDGRERPQPRLHAAGRRQDRHDQRLQRRVVRRVHAQSARRRLGRVRSAADDSAGRFRGRSRRTALGALHEDGHKGRQAAVAGDAAQHHVRQGLPPVRKARDQRLRTSPSRRRRRARRQPTGRVLRVFRERDGTNRVLRFARIARIHRRPRLDFPQRAASTSARCRSEAACAGRHRQRAGAGCASRR